MLEQQIGLDVLKNGGSAADACIAMAAALNVTEPCSCGIGGDTFALYYEASSRAVTAVLGNGRFGVNLFFFLFEVSISPNESEVVCGCGCGYECVCI